MIPSERFEEIKNRHKEGMQFAEQWPIQIYEDVHFLLTELNKYCEAIKVAAKVAYEDAVIMAINLDDDAKKWKRYIDSDLLDNTILVSAIEEQIQ